MQTIDRETLANSPGGIHAKFVDLGDCGLKVYRDENARDSQYANQLHLEELGFSVHCWDCIEFPGPDGDTLYAFYTEKCEVYSDDEFNALGGEFDDDACAYQDEWWGYAARMSEMIHAAGINWSDSHKGNVGRDSKGRLVVI